MGKRIISASEYRIQQSELLRIYEKSVRTCLRDNGSQNIADKISFFRDGVANPEECFISESTEI